MGFESGSVTFRMFYLPGGMPRDAVERFARHAPPPIDTLGRDEINGWVTGRHLLDRVITEENAFVAGCLRLTLMKAERKIPNALLRAECKMAEYAEMQARGVDVLRRDVRSQIKKEIVDRLQPAMPPTLTGIDMVYDPRGEILYAAATSEKQLDAFTIAFGIAAGKDAVPLVPRTAALMRSQINAHDLPPTSFSPECEDELAGDSLGQDFLTWLWFFSEVRGGLMTLEGGEFGVMIDGPLTLVREGSGAHEAIVRKGAPLLSMEAKSSLLSGKKLKRARVILARGEEAWAVTLDADEFVCRGLKLPKGDAVDAAGRLEERMLSIETFREALLGFFDRFLAERADPATWSGTRARMHQWVAERKSQG